MIWYNCFAWCLHSFHIVIFPLRRYLCFCWSSSSGRSEVRLECISAGPTLTLTSASEAAFNTNCPPACFTSLTCELTVVVGAGRVLLVGAERRAGRGAGAEAGVAQGRAHLAGLTAVVDRPLDVQGRGQRGALLGLDTRQEEEKDNS